MSAPEKDAMRFYLTQRLTRRDMSSAKGFDGLFGCQYMGSAEFEFGALPESLARIRKAKRLGIHIGSVTRRDATRTVFVVGDVKRIEQAPDGLTAWMVADYPWGKEMTYFPEAVEGTMQEWQTATDAWWSLTDDVLWTLDHDIAELLLKAVRDA